MATTTRRRWSAYWFLAPYLILFATFVLWPLLNGLRLSMLSYDLTLPAPPKFIGAGNYAEAFGDAKFHAALRATGIFVVFTSPFTVALATLLAVWISSIPGRRQHLYRLAVFVPTVMSISVAALIWRWFYNNDFGLFNAWLRPWNLDVPWLTSKSWAMTSLILMTLWWTVGGPTMILLAALQSIPKTLYEAAAIDGATGPRAFFKITLPLLRPVLLFVIVLNVIGAFQVYGQAYLITNGGPERSTHTIIQYILDMAFGSYRMGYAAAMSWLLFAVIAVFSLVQFYFLRDKETR